MRKYLTLVITLYALGVLYFIARGLYWLAASTAAVGVFTAISVSRQKEHK